MLLWVSIALFVSSVLINFLLLRFLKTLGTKDQAGNLQVRWSSQAKPTIGGISFFAGFLLTFIFVLLFFESSEIRNMQWLGLLSAVSIGFLMGLADDAFNTKPMLKLGVQILCGVILWLTGIEIALGYGAVPDFLITVLWVVGLMNSLNMLDNMDGVTGSVSFALLVGFGLLTPQLELQWMSFGLAASVLGFMVFNWKPAKIYMGDSGSQLLGVGLAAISMLLFQGLPDMQAPSGWVVMLLLVVLFFASINDTTLVTINRLKHGRSPFVGGRDHSTHNLSYAGMKDAAVAASFLVWTIFNVSLVYWLVLKSLWLETYVQVLLIVYLISVFISFFLLSRRNLKKGHYDYNQ